MCTCVVCVFVRVFVCVCVCVCACVALQAAGYVGVLCMPSLSQDDPPNDEEEREGHSDAQTNVNAKEDSRSKGHQPNHLRMCACVLNECVCMKKADRNSH